MQRIERDDGIFADAQFGEQALRGRDFVGLLSNVDVGEQEGRVGRERAQYLSCSAVIEVVEAASQCLAIQRDAALPGGRACGGSHVLLAVGRRPNTDDLDLDKAGVRCDEQSPAHDI